MASGIRLEHTVRGAHQEEQHERLGSPQVPLSSGSHWIGNGLCWNRKHCVAFKSSSVLISTLHHCGYLRDIEKSLKKVSSRYIQKT